MFHSFLQCGQTPLFSASEKGHVAVVQLLIENGANFNIFTPVLHYTNVYFIATSQIVYVTLLVNAALMSVMLDIVTLYTQCTWKCLADM